MTELLKRFWVPIIAALILVMVVVNHSKDRPAPLPPGVFANAAPLIQPTSEQAAWQFEGYTIQPLASCRLRARVLSSKRYRFSWGSDLSPVDLVVGWQEMSDSTFVNRLEISQSSRSCDFKPKDSVLPHEIINAQSKNIHIIPANEDIAKQAKAARPNQVIRAGGWLVKVTKQDDISWNGSLSTGGSGKGSGWIFWVDQLAVENPLLVRLNPVKIGP